MNRRHFLIVLGSTAATACTPQAWAGEPTTTESNVVDAGPLDQFEQDIVYNQFRDQGFFIIRRGDEVFALSSVCTHKGCKVRAQDDQSFLCKCHKSRFDPGGKVLNGPATTNLPRLKVKLSDSNRVLVQAAEKPGDAKDEPKKEEAHTHK